MNWIPTATWKESSGYTLAIARNDSSFHHFAKTALIDEFTRACFAMHIAWSICAMGTARRKLLQLHAVTQLRHLAVPPGNQLEALKGDRSGQHSIRINKQWRICFRWEVGAHDVEIVDYH